MEQVRELFYNLPLLALVSVVVAFVISTCFNLFPALLHLSKTKVLQEDLERNGTGSSKISNLGGIGIFITFCVTMLLFVPVLRFSVYDLINLLSIISALIILLFLGLNHGLISITSNKKLFIQLIVVAMVCWLEDVRITNFHGLLGIWELPYVLSVLFSVIVFVVVINALNLVDGIDGLAAAIGILGSLSFGVFFLMAGYYLMTLMSAILVGSLLGFLTYNLSVKSKIFMGDSGSMIVGFLLTYQGITFLSIQSEVLASYNPENALVLFMAILSYPIFNAFRIWSFHIIQRKRVIAADNNHIHHRLLRLGLSHKQSTVLLFSSNLILVVITYSIINLSINVSLLVSITFGIILYFMPFLSVFEEYNPPQLVTNEAAQENSRVKTENNSTSSDVFDRPIYQHEYQYDTIKVLSNANKDTKVRKLALERSLMYKKTMEKEREAKMTFQKKTLG